MGLWATIHSCEIELLGSGFDYEYVIVVNGETNGVRQRKGDILGLDLDRVMHYLHKSKKLGHLIVKQGALSPPSARQLGSEKANGKLFFFLDNHCLVAKDYFRRSVHDFDRYGMDMLHSATRFHSDDITCYEYQLRLKKNFWADAAVTPKDEFRPYRIAAGGHGGFAVRADVWREVGGYWTGFNGYGGEEMYFDLKMAMLGKTNWIDPLVIHYHYAGQRPYARHYTDDFYRNMMMSANIIGGEEWLYKVYSSFKENYPRQKTPHFDLMIDASDRTTAHRDWLADKRLRTLDEQLDLFSTEDIAQ
jgi:Glycosyl transferase family 2